MLIESCRAADLRSYRSRSLQIGPKSPGVGWLDFACARPGTLVACAPTLGTINASIQLKEYTLALRMSIANSVGVYILAFLARMQLCLFQPIPSILARMRSCRCQLVRICCFS